MAPQVVADPAPAYLQRPGEVPADPAPAYLERLPVQLPAVTVRPGGGGGGGARRPGNPDPYGVKAANAGLASANQGMLGSYDTLAQDESAIAERTAEGQELKGNAQEGAALARLGREQEIQQQNEEQQATITKWVDDSARLNDELSKEKVDPGHYFADKGLGDKLAFGIGGILGGIMSAQPGQGGRNQFVEHVDRLIERDVAAQEKNIANKRASLQQRDSLLGQYMKIHGDKQMAKLQASDRIYQASIDSLEGQMAQHGSTIVRARGQQAVDALKQQQAAKQEQLAQLAADKANLAARQAAAQRAAAAGAARAAEKQAYERSMKEREMRVKEREADGKANKDENFVKRKEISDVEQKVAEARATVQPLIKQMQMTDRDGNPMTTADGQPVYDKGKDLPGLSPAAGLVDNALFRSPLSGKNVLLDDQQVTNRRSLDQMGLAYRNAVTGAGGSDAESAKIEQSLTGARTTAELQAAIQHAENVIQEKVAAAKAAAGPEATREYESNKAGMGRGEMPAGVRIKR